MGKYVSLYEQLKISNFRGCDCLSNSKDTRGTIFDHLDEAYPKIAKEIDRKSDIMSDVMEILSLA